MSLPTPEQRPYWEAVEEFLRALQENNVTSLCMVALCSDEDTHDVVSCWHAGPFEKASAAGILQLHASYAYNHVNDDDDEEECNSDETDP